MCGIWFYYGQTHDKTKLYEAYWKLQPRGPDNSHAIIEDNVFIGFHRLSINDLTDVGSQPMYDERSILVCNGEIYNFKALESQYHLVCTSNSDCETILRLYNVLKLFSWTSEALLSHTETVSKLCKALDGEFAFVIYDKELGKVIACRDRYGVRPLFIGTNHYDNHVGFSSELKGLNDLFDVVEQFEPGTFMIYDMDVSGFLKEKYHTPTDVPLSLPKSEEDALDNIYFSLVAAVEKRLVSDRPICALLSGGLDSSLVCAILSRFYPQFTLNTFSIGLEGSKDLEYARMVSKHIKSVHHEVIVTEEEMLDSIAETVRIIESYDITSVRASAFNRMISRYIKEKSDFKVVFTGEYSDEVLGGYLYFKDAPDANAFAQESERLVNDICFFDSLRADRCISSNGLEARVPFSDDAYIRTIQSIPAEWRMCGGDKPEKYLLRKAFDRYGTLPPEVLWRTKAGFSDSVSTKDNSWHTIIKAHLDVVVTDEEFAKKAPGYMHNTPKTKEAYYYRKEFHKHYKHDEVIPYFWMPKWQSPDVTDPSARTLAVCSD